MNRHFTCVLILIATETTAFGVQKSEEVLAKSQDHLVRINTLDHTFTYSAYERPLRFRSSGVMTRCDFELPALSAEGEPVVQSSIMAFNGEIYQDKRMLLKVMTCSRVPWDEPQKSGPCWTPLEYTFRWNQSRKNPLSWQSLRDPLIWKNIGEFADPEVGSFQVIISNEQVECVRVIIRRPVGSISHVYFAVEKGYFPVKCETFSPDGSLSSTTQVEKLLKITGENEKDTIWFPLIVSSKQEAREEEWDDGFDLMYHVDQESIRVNQDINEEIFTLNYSGMTNVYLNENDVFIPESNKVISLNSIPEPTMVDLSDPSVYSNSYITTIVVLNCIVVIALLIFIRFRKN